MNCLVCGKELIGQQKKYCSCKCKKIAGKRKSRGQAIDVRPRRSHLEWSDEDIQNRINTKSSKIIYCGGYVDSESPMYLYCDDCGQPFKWSAKGLRRQRPIQCDNCREILSNIKAKTREQDIQERKESRHEETLIRQYERKEEHIKSKHRICKECGKPFYAPRKEIYCSANCRNKKYNRIHCLKRRIKIKENIIDKDISLKRLAIRDKDKCWLCGKNVDWKDQTITKNGHYISHGNYPSIDHIVALANGGKHSWDNVRLAHRRCNLEKRDNLFSQNANGQIIFYI